MDIENFLKEHQIQATPLRIKIIEILSKTSMPLAYDEILSQLDANKTTFYRNMELFEQHAIVVKTENNHKNFYELGSGAKAYFVCDVCHKVTSIEVPKLKNVKNIKSVVVKGVCGECE
ncbi:transcriptional repressor [Campylobacter sp. 9BO]|uniref:Fur family transcriptional regulator n=1 Tax=Campylobacter sp. 9BO TaxID=3424759 RepID=UPI003D344A0F